MPRLPGPKRVDDEVCDYCYANRLHYDANRPTTSGPVVNFIPVDPDAHGRCICGPNLPCRDPLCDYYKRRGVK